MSDAVVVALVAAGPATLAALASWRGGVASKKNSRSLETGNGKTIGEYAVYLATQIGELSGQLTAHTKQDDENFRSLNQRLDAIEGTSARRQRQG